MDEGMEKYYGLESRGSLIDVLKKPSINNSPFVRLFVARGRLHPKPISSISYPTNQSFHPTFPFRLKPGAKMINISTAATIHSRGDGATIMYTWKQPISSGRITSEKEIVYYPVRGSKKRCGLLWLAETHIQVKQLPTIRYG